MKNGVRFTFSVVTTTRKVYNLEQHNKVSDTNNNI